MTLVQLPMRLGIRGIKSLAQAQLADGDDVQLGACAFAGALGELWSSRQLCDEGLEEAAVEVFKRTTVRPSIAKPAFWAGFRRVARQPSTGEFPRVVEILSLLAEMLSTEEKDALKVFDGSEIKSSCGEAALLVLLELAIETRRKSLAVRVLKVGGIRVAQRAMTLLVDPPIGMGSILEVAAELVSNTLNNNNNNNSSSSPLLATSSGGIYAALVDDDEALDRANKAWFNVASEQTDAPRFVTKRRGGQRDKPTSFRDESGSMLRPRSSILDVIRLDAVDEELTQRLIAHAADVGVDPCWVRFWREPTVARAQALKLDSFSNENDLGELKRVANIKIEQDLWPSFERSRWWLYE